MFDFPTTPVDGTEYTSGGVTYVYNAATGVWDLASGGSMTDYVLKTGDTMTGNLVMDGGKIDFGSLAAATANDHSKHLHMWSGGTNGGFGITVTSGRLNYNVDATSNSHFFRVANVDKFRVHNTGAHVLGNISVDGYVELNGGGIYIDRTADGYGDSPSLEFRRGNTRTMGLWATVSNNTGYGDYGGFKMTLIRGSYGTQRIMEVLPGQGAPLLTTCPINVPSGSVTAGSGDDWGLFLGDSWHGWVWSSTSNCEHLRSYQGKFEFRKTNAVTPGELLATIDTAGVTTNMFNATAPEAEAVARELAMEPNERGLDLVKALAMCVTKIKQLESEIATLRGGFRV